MKQLHIQEFICAHPDDWQQLLAAPPYCIKISKERWLNYDYYLLMYNQIESDFSLPLVRECRGLILRNDAFRNPAYTVVCMSFTKFFNYGETHAATIDWDSARVQTKEDGSIIRLWYDRPSGHWQISTSGCIDAGKAPVFGFEATFGDLFLNAWRYLGYSVSNFNEAYTYSFELCAPENRVVVPHSEPRIIHIGTRDMNTLEELDIDIGIPKPKEYKFASLEDCRAAVKELPFSQEGYVVVDKHWNRIKIKSPAYVAAFHLKMNGVVTTERILDMIRTGEQGEFLSYYPEYAEKFERVKTAVDAFLTQMRNRISELLSKEFGTQKDFALAVKDERFSACYFAWRKYGTAPEAWLNQMIVGKLAEIIDVVY